MNIKTGDILSEEKILFITEDGNYAIADISYQVEKLTVIPAIDQHITQIEKDLTPEEREEAIQNIVVQSLTTQAKNVEEVDTIDQEVNNNG